jgi:hypothetical protein
MAALPPEVREGLSAPEPVEWIPAEWDIAVVRALRTALGPAASHRIVRVAMGENMSGTLLGSLASTTLRLFGASPGAFFAWAGRAWAHLCRDNGTIRLVSRADDEAVVILSGMPERLASPEYLEAIGACLEALFDHCGVRGEVRVSPTADGARYDARWSG